MGRMGLARAKHCLRQCAHARRHGPGASVDRRSPHVAQTRFRVRPRARHSGSRPFEQCAGVRQILPGGRPIFNSGADRLCVLVPELRRPGILLGFHRSPNSRLNFAFHGLLVGSRVLLHCAEERVEVLITLLHGRNGRISRGHLLRQSGLQFVDSRLLLVDLGTERGDLV
jgi:hypothetical protein